MNFDTLLKGAQQGWDSISSFGGSLVQTAKDDLDDLVQTARGASSIVDNTMRMYDEIGIIPQEFADSTDPMKNSLQDNLAALGNTGLNVLTLVPAAGAGKGALVAAKNTSKLVKPAINVGKSSVKAARDTTKMIKAARPKNWEPYIKEVPIGKPKLASVKYGQEVPKGDVWRMVKGPKGTHPERVMERTTQLKFSKPPTKKKVRFKNETLNVARKKAESSITELSDAMNVMHKKIMTNGGYRQVARDALETGKASSGIATKSAVLYGDSEVRRNKRNRKKRKW